MAVDADIITVHVDIDMKIAIIKIIQTLNTLREITLKVNIHRVDTVHINYIIIQLKK